MRLRAMLVKEFLQMLRDPRMRMVVFGVPVIQMLVMAFALTTDVDHIRTALMDDDRTPISREFVAAFVSSGTFEIVAMPGRPDELKRLLDRGAVRAAVHIPAGFARDLSGGRTATVQLIADGTDSNTAAIVLGYAGQVAGGFGAGRLTDRLRSSGQAPPGRIAFETRAWYNPNLATSLYYVPGLIAIMLLVFSMMLTSIGIVREKELGTIEQVMVTPIRKYEFILGKTIPPVVTGYITMTLMLAIAMVVFGVRVKGSWILFYALTGIYLTGNLGIALLISAISKTQQQALLTAFFIIMPAILLSGFIFPVHNMPLPVQYATVFNPVRWYLEILRGVVMKGVGAGHLVTPICAQGLLALGFVLLASLRFKKTLA